MATVTIQLKDTSEGIELHLHSDPVFAIDDGFTFAQQLALTAIKAIREEGEAQDGTKQIKKKSGSEEGSNNEGTKV